MRRALCLGLLVGLALGRPAWADAGHDARVEQVVEKILPRDLAARQMPWAGDEAFNARVADLTSATVASRPQLSPAQRREVEAIHRRLLRCTQQGYLDAVASMRRLLAGALSRASDAELVTLAGPAGAASDALLGQYVRPDDMLLLSDQLDSEIRRSARSCLVIGVNAMKKIGVIAFDTPVSRVLGKMPGQEEP